MAIPQRVAVFLLRTPLHPKLAQAILVRLCGWLKEVPACIAVFGDVRGERALSITRKELVEFYGLSPEEAFEIVERAADACSDLSEELLEKLCRGEERVV